MHPTAAGVAQSVAELSSYESLEVLQCFFSSVVLVLLAILAVSRAAEEFSSFPLRYRPTITATLHRPTFALFSSSVALSPASSKVFLVA